MCTTRQQLLSCLTANRSELKQFERFLTMEFATENLAFWKLCSAMLKTPTHAIAADIIQNHLLRDSESEINLPVTIKRPLIHELIQLPPQTKAVAIAQEHVLGILLEPYSRFTKTDIRNEQSTRSFQKVLNRIMAKLFTKTIEPQPYYGRQRRATLYSLNIHHSSLTRYRKASSVRSIHTM